MGPATKTVLALVATLVLLEPGQARRAPASATRADAADDSEPPMVTETDPKYRIPEKLLIGVGSASYQTEGAWDKDGKGESVFDHYYHNNNFAVNMTGDVACNSYERYEEDIKLAAELNFNIYRISIAWTRIFPDGDTSKKNEKGVQHYHNVIKAIKAHNMKPVVTLYHFDHPQALEDKFKGWLGDEMIKSFADYADFVFAEYGKEVEYWLTINEPNMHCLMVYNGGLAPGVPGANYTAADVYKCIHNEILAHAAAYRLYERTYRQDQGGRVGFGAISFFSRPNSTQWDDILAAERANMFDVGMVVHPLVFGDYPDVVKETLTRAGMLDRLPVFSPAQKQDVKGAVDYIGLNAYFGMTVADRNKGGVDTATGIPSGNGPRGDSNVTVLAIGDNKDPDPNNSGFANVFGQINAWILRDIALWIKSRFGSGLALFVMENGMGSLTEQSLDDWETRAVYHSAYLREMVRTMNEDDVNYIGYAEWSFLDDFEWSSGYGRRFGIVHVDYERGTLDRTLKRSHHFFKRMMKDRSVPLVQAAAAPPSAAGSSAAALHSALAVTLAAVLSLLNRDSAM